MSIYIYIYLYIYIYIYISIYIYIYLYIYIYIFIYIEKRDQTIYDEIVYLFCCMNMQKQFCFRKEIFEIRIHRHMVSYFPLEKLNINTNSISKV